MPSGCEFFNKTHTPFISFLAEEGPGVVHTAQRGVWKSVLVTSISWHECMLGFSKAGAR